MTNRRILADLQERVLSGYGLGDRNDEPNDSLRLLVGFRHTVWAVRQAVVADPGGHSLTNFRDVGQAFLRTAMARGFGNGNDGSTLTQYAEPKGLDLNECGFRGLQWYQSHRHAYPLNTLATYLWTTATEDIFAKQPSERDPETISAWTRSYYTALIVMFQVGRLVARDELVS